MVMSHSTCQSDSQSTVTCIYIYIYALICIDLCMKLYPPESPPHYPTHPWICDSWVTARIHYPLCLFIFVFFIDAASTNLYDKLPT